MKSTKKIAANRRNARRSTGPSEKAREWTRWNGLKDGLRAKSPILPGEDQEEFLALEQRWVNSLMPRDLAEDELVSDIVKAFWFSRRVERAQLISPGSIEASGLMKTAKKMAADIERLILDNTMP